MDKETHVSHNTKYDYSLFLRVYYNYRDVVVKVVVVVVEAQQFDVWTYLTHEFSFCMSQDLTPAD